MESVTTRTPPQPPLRSSSSVNRLSSAARGAGGGSAPSSPIMGVATTAAGSPGPPPATPPRSTSKPLNLNLTNGINRRSSPSSPLSKRADLSSSPLCPQQQSTLQPEEGSSTPVHVPASSRTAAMQPIRSFSAETEASASSASSYTPSSSSAFTRNNSLASSTMPASASSSGTTSAGTSSRPNSGATAASSVVDEGEGEETVSSQQGKQEGYFDKQQVQSSSRPSSIESAPATSSPTIGATQSASATAPIPHLAYKSAAQALPRRFKRSSVSVSPTTASFPLEGTSSSMPPPPIPPGSSSVAQAQIAAAAQPLPQQPPPRVRKHSHRNSLAGLLSPSLASSLFAAAAASGSSGLVGSTSSSSGLAAHEKAERRERRRARDAERERSERDRVERERQNSAGSSSTGSVASSSLAAFPRSSDRPLSRLSTCSSTMSATAEEDEQQEGGMRGEGYSGAVVNSPDSATFPSPPLSQASESRPPLTRRQLLGAGSRRISLPTVPSMLQRSSSASGSSSSLSISFAAHAVGAAINAPTAHQQQVQHQQQQLAAAAHQAQVQLNRSSIASVASFESVPEGVVVGSFAERNGLLTRAASLRRGSAGSVNGSRRGSAGSARSTSRERDGLMAVVTTSNSLGAESAVTDSPPSSPLNPPAAMLAGHMVPGKPKAPTPQRRALQRSSTAPAEHLRDLMGLMEKRRKTAEELLETERRYVAGLKMIHEAYYQPLHAASYGGRPSTAKGVGERMGSFPSLSAGVVGSKPQAPSLSRVALNEIFSNFSHILHLNTELLSLLEQRLCRKNSSTQAEIEDSITWDPLADDIGDILVSIAPYFKMYSLYVKNFSAALARIETERRTNDAFARFLKQTEAYCAAQAAATAVSKDIAGVGLGFQAHLLSIVQRIPRYKLLVDSLVKRTPPRHKDFEALVTADAVIEQVASSINESIRQHEAALVMLSIQRSLQGLQQPIVMPGRALLLRGTLWKSTRKNVQPREFFLFSDCLIYASPLIDSAGSILWSQALAKYMGSTAAYDGIPDEYGMVWSRNKAEGQMQSSGRTRHSSYGMHEGATGASQGSLFQGQQLLFREKFDLRDCTVVGVEEKEITSNPDLSMPPGTTAARHAFEIRTPGKSFAVYAPSNAIKLDWLNAIRTARADYLQAKRTLLKDDTFDDSIEAKMERRRSGVPTEPLRPIRPNSQARDRALRESGEQSEAELSLLQQQEAQVWHSMQASRPSSMPSSGSSGSIESIAGLLGRASIASPIGLLPQLPSISGGNADGPISWKGLRVLEDYNAPVWVPDNHADRCIRCTELFSLWRRKHHCRLCGQVVCWSCSTKNFLVPTFDEADPYKVARACDTCYESVFPDITLASSPQDSPEQLRVANAARNGFRKRSVTSDGAYSSGLSLTGSNTDDTESPPEPATPAELRSSVASLPSAPLPEHIDWAKQPKDPRGQTPSSEDVSPRSSPAALSKKLHPGSAPYDDIVDEEAEDGLDALPIANNYTRPSGAGTQFYGGSKINMMLRPQMVEAATSGSGTLRLTTPRLTTPEYEIPPSSSGWPRPEGADGLPSSSHDAGGAGTRVWTSYFDNAPASGRPPFPSRESDGAPRRVVDKRGKRMSAAARLSSVYDIANLQRQSFDSPSLPTISGSPPKH